MSLLHPRRVDEDDARPSAPVESSPSFGRRLFRRLDALDFTNQAILLGSGLLISLLPFLIILSDLANERVDDDIALRLGLDHRAAIIVSHLFKQTSLTFNAATVTSFLFV